MPFHFTDFVKYLVRYFLLSATAIGIFYFPTEYILVRGCYIAKWIYIHFFKLVAVVSKCDSNVGSFTRLCFSIFDVITFCKFQYPHIFTLPKYMYVLILSIKVLHHIQVIAKGINKFMAMDGKENSRFSEITLEECSTFILYMCTDYGMFVMSSLRVYDEYYDDEAEKRIAESNMVVPSGYELVENINFDISDKGSSKTFIPRKYRVLNDGYVLYNDDDGCMMTYVAYK